MKKPAIIFVLALFIVCGNIFGEDDNYIDISQNTDKIFKAAYKSAYLELNRWTDKDLLIHGPHSVLNAFLKSELERTNQLLTIDLNGAIVSTHNTESKRDTRNKVIIPSNPLFGSLETQNLNDGTIVISHTGRFVPSEDKVFFVEKKINGHYIPTLGLSAVPIKNSSDSSYEIFNLKKCRRIHEVLKRNQKMINTCMADIEKFNRQLKGALSTDNDHNLEFDGIHKNLIETYEKKAKKFVNKIINQIPLDSTQVPSSEISKRQDTAPEIYQKKPSVYTKKHQPLHDYPELTLKFLALVNPTLEAKEALAACDDYGLTQIYKDNSIWKNYELYPKNTDKQTPPAEKQGDGTTNS